MPPPTGMVHFCPSTAVQSAVMLGAVASAHPFAEVVVDEVLPEEGVELWLAVGMCIGESWVKSDPSTKGPGVARRTADPPPPHVPVFAGDAVAVGKEKADRCPR